MDTMANVTGCDNVKTNFWYNKNFGTVKTEPCTTYS